MSVPNNIQLIQSNLPKGVKLVCVSKFHSVATIQEAYDAGQLIFGESRVQELTEKHSQLPTNIEWHFIGHLQTNKIKQLLPFVSLIHGIDSPKLLHEINKEAEKAHLKVNCLLQVHIAKEDTKFGFSKEELLKFLNSEEFNTLENITVCGLMGMATYTNDSNIVRNEFRIIKSLFDELKLDVFSSKETFKELSIGMSDDYKIAIEEGSTMIRIGSAIFGDRM